MIFGPKKTWASRKRRPMMRQLRKRRLISCGRGAGDDVEVLRLEAEQEVAHAAAHQVRGVPGVFQPPDDVGRVGIDSIQGDVHCA